jgi:EmrB/QacA subfamily drug resistance transporter
MPPVEGSVSSAVSRITPANKIGMVSGLQLTLLLAALDQTIVTTAMPRIVAELNGFSAYAWTTTAYLLTSTAAIPIFGRISDIYGRKIVFITGLILFVAASMLCGLSGVMPVPFSGMEQLIVARALQGLAGGIVMALTFAVVGDMFDPAERGKYQGLFAAVFAVASLAGPTLGGWITETLTWRWVFFVNVPIGLLAALVLQFSMPANLNERTEHKYVDLPGAILLVCFLFPFLLSMTLISHRDASVAMVGGLGAVALCSLIAFLFQEFRSKQPMIPPSLFSDSIISIACFSVFVTGIGMFGSILLLPLLMQNVFKLSATASGAMLSPLMVVVAISSIIGGAYISKSKRYKKLTLAGLAIMAVGTAMLSRMHVNDTLPPLMVSMLIVGVGMGLLLPVYTIVIQNVAPQHTLGIATALSQFFRSIGGTVGTAAFGSLMYYSYANHLSAGLPETESLVASINFVFLIYALMLAVTFIANIFLREVPLSSKK